MKAGMFGPPEKNMGFSDISYFCGNQCLTESERKEEQRPTTSTPHYFIPKVIEMQTESRWDRVDKVSEGREVRLKI